MCAIEGHSNKSFFEYCYAMARIRSITKSAQVIKPHESEVDATYQIVHTPSGETLFHISTYGSDMRASSPKVSQTLQIDSVMAQQLMLLLEETFGSSVRG